MPSARIIATAVTIISLALAAPPRSGPFSAASKKYHVSGLDVTDQHMWVHWPANATAGQMFPLISYAHGFLGGGLDMLGYSYLWNQMASFGFVIVAPSSCNVGCDDRSNAPYTDCAGLRSLEFSNFNSYYGEQLKAIEWARNMSASVDPVFSLVNWSKGVGIAGHSMGGQATAMSAHHACAKQWDIRAAVMHHPADTGVPGGANAGVNITTVPMAMFTSSGDHVVGEAGTRTFTAAPVKEKALRDLYGSSHLEPLLWPPVENPNLGTYTASWFQIYLNGDQGAYHDLVYGNGPDSLCESQKMHQCETHE